MIHYDYTGFGDGIENTYFYPTVFFVPSDITTNLVPATRGLFTIPLGRIYNETIEEQKVFVIENQAVYSDMFIDFISMRHPFSITAESSAFEDGKIIKNYSISDFDFHVEEGSAIIGEEVVPVAPYDFTAKGNTWVYCSLNEDNGTAEIKESEKELQYFVAEEKTYNHLIGIIEYDKDYSGLIIQQKVFQEIASGADTYKIKIVQNDVKPDFLSAKILVDEASEDYPLSSYGKSLIGAEAPSSEVNEEGLSGTTYQFKPIWLYKEISDFKDDKAQVLSHDKSGQLEWIKGYEIELTGSLKDWMQIEEMSGSQYLRWRPEFDLQETAPGEEYLPFYFMSSVKKKKNDKIDKTQVLSGLSFGIDEEKINGIMSWDFLSGYPKCETPPPSSEQVSSWVFAGCEETGLSWKPLADPSGNIILSGSLEDDFEIVKTTSGNVLRWKPEYDEERIPINYFLGEDSETGKWMKWTWFPEGDEKGGIMTWNFPEDSFGEPKLSIPPEETEEVSSFVLAGSKESGLSWMPYITSDFELSGSIENLFELVNDEESGTKVLRVVTEFEELTEPQFYFVNLENDGTLNYSTFIGEPESHGVEGVLVWDYEYGEMNTIITPDYDEEEDFILAGNKEDGMYFVPLNESISSQISEVSGEFYKVAVDEGDLSGDYLYYKLSSISGSINIEVDGSEDWDTVNLEIEPSYFYSSDESIAIEATEDGLDFTISSYLVQVNEGDLPSYLIDKITSASGSLIIEQGEDGEQMTVNAEINPEYFYSSEGSISIEATEEGLDFNLSSYFVQVSEGDLPEYLADKITSASGSLIVDIGENGEGQTVNVEINPEYFFSSDGTVAIEATEDGLDFTLSSAVVSVTEDDLPQFLSDKITSASGSLVVDIGENGEGQTVNLEINPEYFFSSDGTVSIEATEDGLDFTLSSAVVSVTEDDLPQFLSDKISSSQQSLIVDIGENGEGQTVNLEINPEYFFSSDETILIEATEEGIDLKDTCKTKVQEDDESPGYLAEKIEIDPSLEGLITIENTGTQLLLKLAIQGSGLMKIENGQVSVLEAPAGGKYLLACDNGTFSWVEYADCENACDE